MKSTIFYSTDTQTGTLVRRLSNHNFFWKKNSNFFGKWTNKTQGLTPQPMKTLKPFELTYPLRKQLSNSWMLLVHLQENWEPFVLRKYYDSTIFFQMSQFECPYCNREQYEAQTPEMSLYRHLPKTEPQQTSCIKVSWFVRWLTTITS